jgi:hypothetical protein
VPCPFFLPLRPRNETEWFVPPRAPLGRLFEGECHAPSTKQHPEHPTVDGLLCNIGYARGVCPQFPPEAPHDAVRFHRLADGSLLYVFERDHAPVEHGQVTGEGERLNAQAAAFRPCACT